MTNLKKQAFIGLLTIGLGLTGCSQTQVVRVPTPLVQMSSPLDLHQDWQLKTDNFLASDAEGLSIVQSGQQLFFASPDGTVTAARIEGKGAWQDQVVWQKKFSEPLLSGVTLLADGLLVGSAKGNLYKLSTEDGSIIWQKTLTSEVLSLPVVSDGQIFVRSVDGKLYALNTASGEQNWVVEHQLPSLSLRGLPPVTVEGSTLYVGWETGQVQALSAKSGEQLWQTQVVVPKGRTDLERLVDLQSGVLSHQGRLYVLAYHGKLVSLNPENGNLFWSKEVSGYRDLLIHNNMLFSVDEDGILQAYDLANGTKLWQSSHFKYRRLTDLQMDQNGRLVFGDGLGFVHWVDSLDGTLFARAEHGFEGSNGDALIRVQLLGNHLYVQDNEGYLSQYLVKPSDIALFYQSQNRVLNTAKIK